jgi:hypothetical protein
MPLLLGTDVDYHETGMEDYTMAGLICVELNCLYDAGRDEGDRIDGSDLL